MTATQGLRLRSSLPACSGLYVGDAARGRPFAAAELEGLPTGRPGSSRRVVGQPGRARALKEADPALDRSRGGCRTPIRILHEQPVPRLAIRLPVPGRSTVEGNLRGLTCAEAKRESPDACLEASRPAADACPLTQIY